ncbi:MAG: hypothetical protein K9L56_14540 [Clostridiales bacterium]|nr:hypothetical protein [Clostridiales bacterium]
MLSLSEFKSLLQISDVTYDTLFTVYEPGVTGVVEDITGVHYTQTYTAETTEDKNIITIDEEVYDDDVYVGATASADNLPSDTLVWDWTAHTITVDKKASASGSCTLTISSVPAGLKLAIAKMVLFDIKNSTESTANSGSIASKSMSVLSVSYDKNNSIDSRYGYPKTLISMVKRFGRVNIDVGRKRSPYTGTTNRWKIDV